MYCVWETRSVRLGRVDKSAPFQLTVVLSTNPVPSTVPRKLDRTLWLKAPVSLDSDSEGVRRLAIYCQDDIHLAASDQAAWQPRVDLIEPDKTRCSFGKKHLRIQSSNTHCYA